MDPVIGEIKIMSFQFAPHGWAVCNGQLLAISTNQALFALLGTTYGGDGRVTFALPNLQGRIPLHRGAGFTQGQIGGEAAHTLTINELPAHVHTLNANGSAATGTSPANALWAKAATTAYASSPNQSMSPAAIGVSGANQPHQNMPPYLTMNFCIALVGVFPSRG